MGEELVSELPEREKPPQKTATEIFYEALPHFIAIGMSTEEFWKGDPQLAVAYRKAYRLKARHENYISWLNGRYFYDAIVAGVGGMFSKQKVEYLKEPYPSDAEEAEQKRQDRLRLMFKRLKAEAERTEAQNNG